MLTVERLDDGEVSQYLVDELRAGDEIELRGPIGGYFVWEESSGGPLLLIGGGSGVVPLRAIVRHHQAVGSQTALRLLYSARSLDEVIYRDELERLAAGGRARSPPHPHPRLARRVAGVSAAPRQRDAAGRFVAGKRTPAGLHLRADGLRRACRGRTRRARPRSGQDQDRAFWTDGKMNRMAAGCRDLDQTMVTQRPGAGHPLPRSAEPGEDWSRCFLDVLALGVASPPPVRESR